jgi:hypothetical protein
MIMKHTHKYSLTLKYKYKKRKIIPDTPKKPKKRQKNRHIFEKTVKSTQKLRQRHWMHLAPVQSAK